MPKVFKIKLGQLLSSLSFILDVSENRYFNHSRRTAYISYAIAKEMAIEDDLLDDIYYASLLHDIGMGGQMFQYSIPEIHNNESLMKEHCKVGFQIVKKLPLDKNIPKYILYHHENWNDNKIFGINRMDIPLPSQIIHVADYMDILYLRKMGHKDYKIDVEDIKCWLKNMKGKAFSPDVVDALFSAMDREKFWLDLKPSNLKQVLDIIEPGKDTYIDIGGLKSISEAFSALIDQKSKFTFEHSQGVARITKNLAIYSGYDPLMVEKLQIAANLHDIGKFIVPNSILEKPARLTKDEFQVIKSHVYYTKLILMQIDGLGRLADWAGNHHERLNGTGYPEKLDYRTLTKEDQIIAISDIYQALTEKRPYRKGLVHDKAIDIMLDMAKEGNISKSMVLDLNQLI